MTGRVTTSESGQAIAMAIVALGLFVFGAIGLGLDGAQIFAQQQMVQAAADAAAQAAATSIMHGTNSTSTNPFSTSASFTCTVPPSALDLRTPCVYAQDNGFGTSADTVIVSFPTSITGVTLASTPAVQVNVHRAVKTGFMQFFGITSTTVYAKALAGVLSSGGSSTCIYALGKTGNTFIDTGSGNLTTTCGVYANGGMNITASGTITTTNSQYYGSFSGNSSKMSPAPTQVTSYVSDPFASVPFPTFANTCDQTNYHAPAGALPAGTYCNGLTISTSGNVTLSGQYIINGGHLSISGSGTVSGTNVTFFITGQYGQTAAAVSFTGSGPINLSAPSSGTYEGMLVYQDRNVTYGNANTISMSGGSTTSGSWYFPTTELDYTGSGAQTGTGAYQAIVASTVKITGSGNLQFNADPTGQYTGIGHATAGLVQ